MVIFLCFKKESAIFSSSTDSPIENRIPSIIALYFFSSIFSVHPAIHDNLCCNFRINLDIIKNMFLRNPYRSHFHQLQNRKKRNDHFHFR